MNHQRPLSDELAGVSSGSGCQAVPVHQNGRFQYDATVLPARWTTAGRMPP